MQWSNDNDDSVQREGLLLWSLEHVVELLSDSDESGSSTQFLQFLGPDVGTG